MPFGVCCGLLRRAKSSYRTPYAAWHSPVSCMPLPNQTILRPVWLLHLGTRRYRASEPWGAGQVRGKPQGSEEANIRLLYWYCHPLCLSSAPIFGLCTLLFGGLRGESQRYRTGENKVQECATGTPYPSGHRRHGCAKSTNVGTDSFFSIANVPSQPKATVH